MIRRCGRDRKQATRATLLRRAVACCLCIASGCLLTPDVNAQLTAEDFRPIGEQGMGDLDNGYAWSLQDYKGKIFFGSNRHFLCLSRTATGSSSSVPPEFPIRCEDDTLDMDLRAKIWAYDPVTGEIEMVHQSPTEEVVESDGTRRQIARDMGYRTMAVFTEADGTEALYVGTFTSRKLPGSPARILRTTDGKHFTEVVTPFSNEDGFNAYRSMRIFNNKLYVCVVGANALDSVLLEASDPKSGDFRIVPLAGDSDITDGGPYSLAEFDGYLYISVNYSGKERGFSLLKTRAEGDLPYDFVEVLTDGAYRGPANESLVSMAPYGDWLYLGSGLFGGFRVLPNEVGAAGAELLRINAYDEWELLVGQERDTPDGPREPITGYNSGFNNEFTGYIWAMVEHEGVFYLGTFDKSFAAQYAEGVTADVTEDLPDFTNAFDLSDLPIDLDNYSFDELLDLVSAVEGGFDIWTTVNGTDWERVTRSGLGDEFAYGVRNWLSTDHGLYFGTANPFFGFQIYLGQPFGTDNDGDSYPDAMDNCPLMWNLSQNDFDGDGVGDECDRDVDGDCIMNHLDTLPGMPDEDFPDSDEDGETDPCDSDIDGDTVLNHQDNCPLVTNYEQRDADADGVGDACDASEPATPGNDADGGDGSTPAGDGSSGESPSDPDDPSDDLPTATPACGGGVPMTAALTAMLGLMFCGALRRRS